MKIQTPGTGGLARSISGHETGLPEKPPLQATRKGGKWRVVHSNVDRIIFTDEMFTAFHRFKNEYKKLG